MEYRVLGPLEALHNGRHLNLGGAKQQAVLASLLLHADQTVALERLVDELWDEAPPETAQKTIQVYVSRLRRSLFLCTLRPVSHPDRQNPQRQRHPHRLRCMIFPESGTCTPRRRSENIPAIPTPLNRLL